MPASVPQGNRHGELTRYVASRWGSADHPDEDGLREAAREFAQEVCNPALPEREALSVADWFIKNREAGLSAEYADRAESNKAKRTFKSEDPFPLEFVDDMTLSGLFAERYRDELLFNAGSHDWWAYDRKRGVWQGDAGLRAAELLEGFIELISREANSKLGKDEEGRKDPRIAAVRHYRSQRSRKSLLENCAHKLAFDPEGFDASPDLFNCRNVTLELKPYPHAREHRPEDHLTKVAGCDFDPKAGHAEWDKFLAETFEGNGGAKLAGYLKQVLGRTVAGEGYKGKTYFLMGKTRTGKSTFVNVLKAALGDYASGLSASVIIKKRTRGAAEHDASLAEIRGLRMGVISEWESGDRLGVAALKRLTGGDEQVARNPYGHKNEHFVSTATIFLATNYLPSTTDDTIFTSRRVVVVPFENAVPESKQDPELENRLKTPEALAGVLAWCIEGLCAVRTGLVTPTPLICEQAREQYAHDSDIVGRFIEDACRIGPEFKGSGQTLYSAFTKYCEETGMRPMNQQEFYRELEKHGYADLGRKRLDDRSMPSRVFSGIEAGPLPEA